MSDASDGFQTDIDNFEKMLRRGERDSLLREIYANSCTRGTTYDMALSLANDFIKQKYGRYIE